MRASTRPKVAADQIAFVLGLAIGGAILVGFGFVDLWLRTVHGNDFSGFWAGPRAFLDGVDPYDPGRFPDVVARYGTQDTEPVYGYPPWDLLVVLPFAALPLEVASIAWLVIGLGLAVIGLGTLLAERAPGLPSVHFLVGLSLLASQPALITFYSGQWGFLLTGTLALTVRWLGVGSSRRAGVAALAMVTKPQLFVFAAWALIHTALARRQAAFIAVAAGGASALVAFSWLLFPGWLGAFLTHIAPMRTSYPPRSVTIATPLGEMLGPTGLWLVLPIMAVVLVVALRFDAKSDASLAVWLVASVGLASYAWSYDHLVLLVPIVLAVGALRFDRTRATVVGVLSCVALIVEALFLYQLSAARGSQSLNALVPLSVFAVVVGGLWPYRMAGRRKHRPGDSVRAMASTPPAGPPPPPPITDIDLDQFAEIVNTARIDEERGLTTGLVATAASGQPDLALKGSLMVWDTQHLAWWERSKRETFAALASNSRVAIFVRNPTKDRRTLRFYGEARVVADGPEREAVWERVLPIEKDMDKERTGVAVIVRVDRVRAGPFDIQRRGG